MKLTLRIVLFEETTLRIFYCVEFVIKNESEESSAALAQLGERQTEDLKAPCSIHGGGTSFSKTSFFFIMNFVNWLTKTFLKSLFGKREIIFELVNYF